MNISKECLIVNICVSTWQGQKLDRELTAKTETTAKAKAGTLRVTKYVVPSESLKGITNAIGRVRRHLERETLPWRDNGDRLLTRKNYPKFIEHHSKLVHEHDKEVDDFLVNKYPEALEQAEFRMVDAYNPADYPTVSELRRRFAITLDVEAVAKAFDVRLQDNMGAIQQRVNTAVAQLWKRLEEPLVHFTNKMTSTNEDETFKAATLNNLKNMAEFVGQMNFTGDEALEAIREEIEATLVGYEAEKLRKDDQLRASVGATAADILSKMQGYMAAFGGGDE
jgi:hypothetical protein